MLLLDVCRGRLKLVATDVVGQQQVYLQNFESKQEIINANMASIHIPFFLDFRPFSSYQSVILFTSPFIIVARMLVPCHHFHYPVSGLAPHQLPQICKCSHSCSPESCGLFASPFPELLLLRLLQDWRERLWEQIGCILHRGRRYVDGSLTDFLFWENGKLLTREGRSFVLDYSRDSDLEFGRLDFVKLRSYESVLELMAQGRR